MSTCTIEYKIINIDELNAFAIREIRPEHVEKLKVILDKKGYDNSKPLVVVKNGDFYDVVDGNHRFAAALQLDIKEIPCNIEIGDPFKLAYVKNQSNSTYVKFDLFDFLELIKKVRSDIDKESKKVPNKDVAERIGVSLGVIKHHITILKKIDTEILNLLKIRVRTHVSKKDTTVSFFKITENWFRKSGLYNLTHEHQLLLVQECLSARESWSMQKFQKEAKKHLQFIQFEGIAKKELVDSAKDYPIVESLIRKNSFFDEASLRTKTKDLNSKANNILRLGKAEIVLQEIPDKTIDVVITDIPYGINYKANLSKYSDHIGRKGILNDKPDEALTLLENLCETFDKKVKDNAHLYFFSHWRMSPYFMMIISKYFEIQNKIIWYKEKENFNSGGDLDYAYGNCYEEIIFATKGSRRKNEPKPDVLIHRIVKEPKRHPNEKPIELISELLEFSARYGDIFCDPCMGSGSAIKAAKDFGPLSYIGIELDEKFYEKAKAWINSN